MEISVHLPDSSLLPLVLSAQASVASLKAIIQQAIGVPAAIQQLSTPGKLLTDQQKIRDCGPQFAVSIVPPTSFLLRFTIRRPWGMRFCVMLPGTKLVREVRKGIAEVMGERSEEARLFVEGKELEDRQTLTEVYCDGKFVIDWLRGDEFSLAVNDSNGNSVQVPASQSDTVLSFLSRVKEYTDWDSSGQAILYQGHTVNTSASLVGLGIIGGISCVPPSFYLWARTIGIPRVLIALNPAGSILPAVTHIASSQFKAKSIWVLCKGKVIDSSATPLGEGLPSGTVIDYGDLLIHVRTCNIEKWEIAVPSHSSVHTLKHELITRLNRSQFKLVYCGVELSDASALSDCGLGTEAVIEVIGNSDKYLWVDSGIDRIAIPYTDNVLKVVSDFQVICRTEETYDLLLHNGTDVTSIPKVAFSSGDVLYLRQRQFDSLIQVRWPGNRYNIAARETDTVDQLIEKLKPVVPAVKFAGVAEGESTSMLLTNTLGLVVEDKKYMRLLYSDLSVEVVPIDQLEKVSSLKSRIDKGCVELVCGETSMENGKSIEEYPTCFSEVVCVCREHEFILLEKRTNHRSFITIPHKNSTISDLKAICQRLLGEPALLFRHTFLTQDSTPLESIGIATGSCIHAISASSYQSILASRPLSEANRYIFIQKHKYESYLLCFHHSEVWTELQEILETEFASKAFTLTCSDRLLTSLSKVDNGGTVHLHLHSESVLFRDSSGLITQVYVSPKTLLAHARTIGNIPDSLNLVCGAVNVNGYSAASVQKLICIVDCVGEGEVLYYAKGVGVEDMSIVHCERCIKAHELLTSAQVFNRDITFSPRFYIDWKHCRSEDTIWSTSNIAMLPPPLACIRVRLRYAQSLVVFVDESGTVGTLRTLIAEELGMQVYDIRIVYQRCLLTNDMESLSAIGVVENNEVEVLRQKELLLLIQGRETLAKVVETSTILSELKLSIFHSESRDIMNGKIIFNGAILDDNKTLEDYSLPSIATLQIIRESEKLLSVSHLSGRTVQQIASIADISLSLLGTMFGRSIDSSRPIQWFGELSEMRSCEDYGIRTGDTLFLANTCGKRYKKRQIYAKRLGPKLERVYLNLSVTPEALVSKMQIQFGPTARVLVNEQLTAQPSSEWCKDICDGIIVTVLVAGELCVFLNCEEQQFTAIAVKEMAVKELKTVIMKTADVPSEVQVLYWNEMELTDDMSLMQFEEEVVTVTMRIRPLFLLVRSIGGVVAVHLPTENFTVGSVKKVLGTGRKKKGSRNRFFHGTRELLDEDIVSTNSTRLEGLTIDSLGPEDLHLFIRSSFAQYSIYVKRTETVKMVKKKVFGKVGVHYSRLKLMGGVKITGDKELQMITETNHWKLAFCDIADNTSPITHR